MGEVHPEERRALGRVEKHLVSLYEHRLIRAALRYLVLTELLGVLFFLFPSLILYFRATHFRMGAIGFFSLDGHGRVLLDDASS